MSAVLKPGPRLAAMSEADLDEVMLVEQDIYDFPWTRGNFRDSLEARYDCVTYRDGGGALLGYAVMLIGAGEAHLLNLSIARAQQRRGHGRSLLSSLRTLARERGAHVLFLEVRPSNEAGRRLYTSFGFAQVGVRKGYYPAAAGREDALVYAMDL